ncbi:beta-galactosidase [Acetatifactor aquisgranensis]|uniref:beta-galactosidase n=1 Tax=Acetatifactor aquisgranensis TaxID=2941233 RepID=UPI00203DC9A0|nr:beta-galactosidase [Acetatifactor aquisgranensis]
MRQITMDRENLMKGSVMLAKEQASASCTLQLSKEGSGILLPQLIDCKEHLLTFYVEVLEEHSLPMHLLFYVHGEKEPALEIRFGLLPKVRSMVCIDLGWLDGRELFPEAMPGTLKIVCHGRRVFREEIEKAVLSSMACFHDVKIKIEEMALRDEYPVNPELPDEKLVDCFGQDKRKSWKDKTGDLESLKARLQKQYDERDAAYPFEDWTEYGGWKKKKLKEGTGYFSSCKEGEKWWLADPLGYAYFSMGPDCVGPGSDCRVDGVEKWLDWLPDRQDAAYKDMFFESGRREAHRTPLIFSYAKANLYKVFGENWYDKWKDMMGGQLKKYGMNTLGNWSDRRLLGTIGIPYVTSLPEFPATKQCIFRDFPDVFSEEYAAQARRCAQALEEKKEDPLMIGYFLRNEPAWAFVDNLMLADEVLYNPEKTACKEKLIAFLTERYQSIEKLNASWGSSFEGFESLYRQQKDASKHSEAAKEDMREFSRRLMRAYVEIPVRECRKVDPNHMILGMRWAWISNPDLATGWENFDVFSINCYAVDPTDQIQGIVDLGVDLPVMIGEFHFGALDAGLPATGLEGVESQEDRGVAYRYYCESVAAHPNGVGCHYFQCYDQFVLGRFDGENYNIGLFDVCSCAYPEMMEHIRECSGGIYEVADGKAKRSRQKPKSIPMIAY